MISAGVFAFIGYLIFNSYGNLKENTKFNSNIGFSHVAKENKDNTLKMALAVI